MLQGQSALLQQLATAQEQLAAMLQQQSQKQQLPGNLLYELQSLSCVLGPMITNFCQSSTSAVAEMGRVAVAAAQLCNSVLQHYERVCWGSARPLAKYLDGACLVVIQAVGNVYASGVDVPLPATEDPIAGCCAGANISTCDITAHPAVLQLIISLLCVTSAALAAAHSSSSSNSADQTAATSSSAAAPAAAPDTPGAAATAEHTAAEADSTVNSPREPDTLSALAQAVWASPSLGMPEAALAQFAAAQLQHGILTGQLAALVVFLNQGLWNVQEPGDDGKMVEACGMHPQQRAILQESGWALTPLLLATAIACECEQYCDSCEKLVRVVGAAFSVCLTATLPPALAVHEACQALDVQEGMADLQSNVGGLLSNVLHYLLQYAEQQTLLLAAAFNKQQEALSSSSSGSSSGPRCRSNAAAKAAATQDLSERTSVVYSLLQMLAQLARLYGHSKYGRYATIAWQQHSKAAAGYMELLTRLVLNQDPKLDGSEQCVLSRGRGTHTGRLQQPGLAELRHEAAKLLQLLLHAVEGSDAFSAPLTIGTGATAFNSGDERQQLFGLIVSFSKYCASAPHATDPAMLEAFSRLPAQYGSMLATQLAREYSLEAVRAAVAPWRVLLGRLMRVAGVMFRQRLGSAFEVLQLDGGAVTEVMDGFSLQTIAGLVRLLHTCLTCVRPGKAMRRCWLQCKEDEFMGSKLFPESVAKAAVCSSSGALPPPPLLHPKNHMQRPGLPAAATQRPAATAAAGGAAAGANAGALGSQASAAIAALGTTPAAAAGCCGTGLECVLLDDLDDWFDLHLEQLTISATAAWNAVVDSGVAAHFSADQEDYSSGRSHVAETILLIRLLQRSSGGQECAEINQLPEQLYAAGTALCNALPVPWLCNNPDCTNMAGASEAQLVGGKSCVCGSCKVARYCGRACQTSHWKQHKPVCKRLATRAGEMTPAAPAAVSASAADATAACPAASTPQA